MTPQTPASPPPPMPPLPSGAAGVPSGIEAAGEAPTDTAMPAPPGCSPVPPPRFHWFWPPLLPDPAMRSGNLILRRELGWAAPAGRVTARGLRPVPGGLLGPAILAAGVFIAAHRSPEGVFWIVFIALLTIPYAVRMVGFRLARRLARPHLHPDMRGQLILAGFEPEEIMEGIRAAARIPFASLHRWIAAAAAGTSLGLLGESVAFYIVAAAFSAWCLVRHNYGAERGILAGLSCAGASGHESFRAFLSYAMGGVGRRLATILGSLLGTVPIFAVASSFMTESGTVSVELFLALAYAGVTIATDLYLRRIWIAAAQTNALVQWGRLFE